LKVGTDGRGTKFSNGYFDGSRGDSFSDSLMTCISLFQSITCSTFGLWWKIAGWIWKILKYQMNSNKINYQRTLSSCNLIKSWFSASFTTFAVNLLHCLKLLELFKNNFTILLTLMRRSCFWGVGHWLFLNTPCLNSQFWIHGIPRNFSGILLNYRDFMNFWEIFPDSSGFFWNSSLMKRFNRFPLAPRNSLAKYKPLDPH
jgi:hypothetical protein